MFFLAGLLGIATMGAAAFSGFQSETDADDPSADAYGREPHGSSSEGSDGLVRMLDHATTGSSDDTPLPVQGHDPAADPGAIISGTGTADMICGSEGPDQINGDASEDRIDGAGGADILLGGDGADMLSGSGGDDTLHGNDGQDTLRGGDGQDHIFGHNAGDVMAGDGGDDTLHGGDGQDEIHGGAGDDALHGGLDDDRLSGDAGSDTLFGGWGDDTVSGHEPEATTDAVDFLNGGGGDDVLLADALDIVTGGSGADEIVLGDWITQGHQSEILDFAPQEDALVVFFDDTSGSDPSLSIDIDRDNPDDRHVVLNGVHIATVLNAPGLTLDHIALLPQTALGGVMGA